MRNVFVKKEPRLLVRADETLKTTALAYLKEALQKEDYENCKEFIESAKEFGANQAEINGVIAVYLLQLEKRFAR